ncbi:neurexin-1 isoform X2 [Copidosoma floridanum]|uniref:neurexin-1 isoform X2 n=1 Tax=Copidosoma floridanum TaxID=29053 RepID=UPI000C6F8F13|nr:neurexin-1 isoform X2 [Copidosoma floridanum]
MVFRNPMQTSAEMRRRRTGAPMMVVQGLAVAVLLLAELCGCLLLDGTSAASYAQFPRWSAGLNGSLEFEFKTKQGNGLLFYTDDGGNNDFFELKLVEGALRLRYNLGGGAQLLSLGRELGDGAWHKVLIERDRENTTLVLDGQEASSSSRGTEYEFGHLPGNSDVYVGAMPGWYSTKLTLLALPSVMFEPRFNGLIRNLVYADEEEPGLLRRQDSRARRDDKCNRIPCVDMMGTRKSKRDRLATNETDPCLTLDPCKNNGICMTKDLGPYCECRNGDYEGIYCENGKTPQEAAFKGTEYLTIDLNKGSPVLSTQEGVFFQFKTRQPNGLLFYSRHGQDHLAVSLRDGGVSVAMVLSKGRLELHIKPARIRFDDNQWHTVAVNRIVQEISPVTNFCRLTATVDKFYAGHGHTAGSFTRLASERLFVGGGLVDAKELSVQTQGSKGTLNFIGCMRKVEFHAEKTRLDLIQATLSGTPGAAAWGKIVFQCKEPRSSDSVTFTTRDSHLVLPPWKTAESGSISFKIRTNEPNGLVMYSRSGSTTRSDLFAFEILDGFLYLHMDLGEGPVKVRASEKPIDDSTWHEITLRRVLREGRVVVDESPVEFRPPGDQTQLDLDGLLYIGGVGAPFAPLTVPPVLWTGSLRQGYVGCMRDLVINGQPIDIAGYAQQQDSGAVRPACHAQGAHCNSRPCMHSGRCVEGWNRYHCDCTGTAFTGATCGKDASTLYLNGSQQMTALMPEDSKTQAEEVVVRFKTTRPRGLLLATSLENSVDRLQISLEDGAAKVLIHIDQQEKTLVVGQGLNDDQWHTLRFSRRANIATFRVDEEKEKRDDSIFCMNDLEFKTMHVGGYLNSGEEVPHFVGALQQIWFNGYPYLEIARSAGTHQTAHQGLTPIIRVTGTFGKRNHPVHHPVTFTSKHTFVGLPVLKAYVETNIYLQFKTREANGLILYNAGRERDFIAVELVNGHVYYTFDLGDGPVRLRDSTKSKLNDGQWHAISIARPAPRRHALAVDDHVAVANSPGNNENLDLDGILYIGGVEKAQYLQLPNPIVSRHGFEGCLASLDLSGESPDLISDAVIPSSLVESGCDAYANLHPGKKCTHDMCANHGTCVQQWNSYTCDCDMTSFAGPTCADEAVSYEFRAERGLITYTFPPDRRPEMKRDTLAVGFITTVNDAVLLRIESASSTDYLEIKIVEGNVFAVYNIGSNDHPIDEIGMKVNDNQYHVIRFTRSGANSTLQVDDYNLQSNHPQGNQHIVFNSQSTIQVGGRWNRGKNKIDKPFLGIMSGLVVNEARIFELAATKDSHVTVKGDVHLLPVGSLVDRAAPLQRMQQTPASGFPGVADDLIFSGAGSGCAGDDEDEDCTPIYENGSDDLITPVYVPPTKSPVVITKPKSPSKNLHEKNISCDDEEECNEEGSGDSTTEEIFVVTSSTTLSSSSAVGFTTQQHPSTARGTTSISTSTSTLPSSPARDLFHTTTSAQLNLSSDTSTSHSTRVSVVTHDSRPSSTSLQTSTTTEIMELPTSPRITYTYGNGGSVKGSDIYLTTTNRNNNNNNNNNINNNNNGRVMSEGAENIALVIVIAAAIAILLTIIGIIYVRYKTRPERNYKIDDGKSFSQEPNAALLGGGANAGQNYAGALRNGQGNGSSKNGKNRGVKDIKEWYV